MMSNEIAPMGDMAQTMPVPAGVSSKALALMEQQAQALDIADRLAQKLCKTQMIPKAYWGKPDDAAVAILHGAELGMPPHQALQQIFVINGKPAIYARTMAGLLMPHGYLFKTVETSDTSVTVQGTGPRGEDETSTWTIERAAQAGYTKNALYKSNPKAMLYAKALGEVARKIAPDVLMGMAYMREELELQQPVRAEATRLDGRGAAGLRQALAAQETPPPAPQVQELQPDIDSIIMAFQAATTPTELGEVLERAKAMVPVEHERFWEVKAAFDAKAEELQGGVDSPQ